MPRLAVCITISMIGLPRTKIPPAPLTPFRFMKQILRIAALLLLSLAAHAAPAPVVSSTIVMPWDLRQNPGLVGELRSRGVTHATVYLNWSDIEARRGQYEFTHYHQHLDALVQGGLSLILVLDMGGRPYLNDHAQLVPDTYTVPLWLTKEQPLTLMKNFSGNLTPQPDFTDIAIQKYAHGFITQTVRHFSQRYSGKILGYAIGLQEEHEIKYGQTGYQWRDYKESTQADFLKKYGAKQPVINYNNNIAAGVPKAEPLLYTHKEYRENRLKDATCTYASAIRSHGAQAIGYFAETFTSHDGIYATGIVEKLVDCIDIAVIDYNFFDGYSLVDDADVLPTLANYMGSLGYRQIMVGAYAEQWAAKGKIRELMPAVQRSIAQSLAQERVIGYEVGGFMHRSGSANPLAELDLSVLERKSATLRAAPAGNRPRIGILGSATNFYLWHGERSAGRNTHRDALFAAYQILSSQSGISVHLIGEKNLLQDDPLVQTLDAILVPHQAALPHSVKSRLTTFWKNGGALIQDMRLGEFDENGKPTFDWMHEVFGIANIDWKKRGGVFLIDGNIYRLKPSARMYTSYASITPRPGYKVLATDLLQRDRGIMVRGERTLVFGFMPQLIDDETKEAWQKMFVRELRSVATRKPHPGK